MIKAASTVVEKISPAIPEVAERGADAERRTLILDCAEAMFLEQGFQAASMAGIAARSGCSKGTLYNYFVSKEELFLACVARQCAGFQKTMSTLTTGSGPLRETLFEIGRRYVEFVSSDRIVRGFRMIVAEAERAPDMARAFYAAGPARGAETLAAYLDNAMQGGQLRKLEPLRAAHHFLGLCYDRHSKARLCNFEPPPDAATIERDVDDAVRIFIAAYGA